MASPEASAHTQPGLTRRRFLRATAAGSAAILLAACGGKSEGKKTTTTNVGTAPKDNPTPVAPQTISSEEMKILVQEYVRWENSGLLYTLNPDDKKENPRVGGNWIYPDKPELPLPSMQLTIAAEAHVDKGELGVAGVVFTGRGLGLKSSNPEKIDAWHIFARKEAVDQTGKYRGAYTAYVDFAKPEEGQDVPAESKIELGFDVYALPRPGVDKPGVKYLRKASPNGIHVIYLPKAA